MATRDDPDFRALARAWVAGDGRLEELRRRDPDAAERLTARLAEALDRRRREVDQEQDPELVVRLHSDGLDPAGRPRRGAVTRLSDYLTEQLELHEEP